MSKDKESSEHSFSPNYIVKPPSQGDKRTLLELTSSDLHVEYFDRYDAFLKENEDFSKKLKVLFSQEEKNTSNSSGSEGHPSLIDVYLEFEDLLIKAFGPNQQIALFGLLAMSSRRYFQPDSINSFMLDNQKDRQRVFDAHPAVRADLQKLAKKEISRNDFWQDHRILFETEFGKHADTALDCMLLSTKADSTTMS